MSVFAIYLIFSMLAVVWFDGTRYIIPNWLCASLLLLYPAAVYMAPVPVDWKMALAAFGIMFIVGILLFTLRLMGGGDIKLIMVMGLWVGWQHLLDFVFLFGVLGGVLSVVLWLVRKAMPYLIKDTSLPKILRNGEPVPYGLAIAAAVLILMWMGQISVAVVRG